MKFFKRPIVCCVTFILVFLLLTQIFSFCFLSKDAMTLLPMYEYNRQEKIDLCFVGSSWTRNSVDPEKISAATGKSVFDLALSAADLPAQLVLSQKALKEKSPEMLILEYDPRSFIREPEERPTVAALASPYLKLSEKAPYTLRLAMQDGLWLDRLFPWRVLHPGSLKDVRDNIERKVDPDSAYQKWRRLFEERDDISYKGNGHFVFLREPSPQVSSRKTSTSETVLNEKKAALYKQLIVLCKEEGVQLAFYTPPQPTGMVLSRNSIFNGVEAMQNFCESQDIPYFNFVYADHALLASMDDYFFDGSHFNGEGAAAFSDAFGTVLADYLHGQDVSNYFVSQEEYLASVDYIVNTWLNKSVGKDKITYTADANYGPTVIPFYRFVAVDATGKETVLQDYSEQNTFVSSAEKPFAAEAVRVYAINKVQLEQKPVSYDWVDNR